MCLHNIPTEFLTSTTDRNPMRRFFRCTFRDDNDCKFFEWFDPDMPSYQKGQFVSMMAQKDSLEEQLNCKAQMEKLMYERLTNAGSKMEELNILNANLEKKVEELLIVKAQLIEKNRSLKTKLKRSKYVTNVLLILVCVQIVVLSWTVYGGGREMVKQHLMLS